MLYEVSDNRIEIDEYFFEMDSTNYNIHVYKKGMVYFDMIEVNSKMPYDVFKQRCNEWIIRNK